jgi:hypothetical protein
MKKDGGLYHTKKEIEFELFLCLLSFDALLYVTFLVKLIGCLALEYFYVG